jgi:predicted MFS family arabinose efflux permease
LHAEQCRFVPFWLFALLFGAFVFYTDDYVIAGVLPEIATDLQVHADPGGVHRAPCPSHTPLT